jgi:hypothetical protein
LNLIKKATSDLRIGSLLAEVSSNVKIKYKKIDDSGWSVNLENGTALICYCGCKHPSASLAHELLHLDTQLRGYKRMRISISSIDQTNAFKILIDALDNELQHHKFYKAFIDIGFTPDQFYQDSDAETENHLNEILKQTFESIVHILPHYLTAIAPGGTISNNAREQLKKDFKSINGGQFSGRLDKIERLISIWTAEDSYDAIPTVKEIMLTIQPDNNLTWIGFDASDRPPERGFFIDKVFSVQLPS